MQMKRKIKYNWLIGKSSVGEYALVQEEKRDGCLIVNLKIWPVKVINENFQNKKIW